VYLDDILETYYTLEPKSLADGQQVFIKPGVRGYPDLHPGVSLLLERAALAADVVIDATGSAGALAAGLRQESGEVTVFEGSRAALTCAQKTLNSSNVEISAGAPWSTPQGSADAIYLIPATDRGTARVNAEFLGAFNALKEGGAVYFVMHKDQGAKRYEKSAKSLFGDVSVLAKNGGWRLARSVKHNSIPNAKFEDALSLISFEAAGLKLEAEPGVYAAGKLDPGTAALLEAFEFESLTGKRVLDLGCGYGLLALKAALAGAEVTAVDDDLTAVRSTYKNAKTYGLDIRPLHSDVISELKEKASFEACIMNPPFHVGKAVRLELPHAFIAGAYRVLGPGGELVLVANKALAYEPLLNHFAYWEMLTETKTFKVLRAIR